MGVLNHEEKQSRNVKIQHGYPEAQQDEMNQNW